jgi:REP-associated tyrosine transposase
MARPLRLEFAGAVYHLTSRGNDRQKVFFSDADRELFLNTLSGVVSRYGWATPTV